MNTYEQQVGPFILQHKENDNALHFATPYLFLVMRKLLLTWKQKLSDYSRAPPLIMRLSP
jgi:hypothetical protein